MLFQCWPNVFDAGPTLKQHLANASCLLGYDTAVSTSVGLMFVKLRRRWTSIESFAGSPFSISPETLFAVDEIGGVIV